jgi:hypothetical protein
MKISFALVIATMLVFFQMPARGSTIYPARCHVYDDTSLIGIPGQCGTILPFYPRKLYVRSSRTRSYHYYPNYYCPEHDQIDAARRNLKEVTAGSRER